ncbi:MAG TPA: hypothetical protein VF584_24275 [Longimicrobium sp.]|jgi:hypothetical protein
MMDEEELIEAYMRDAGAGVPAVGGADWLDYLLPSLDYQSQLVAIQTLLRRQQDADRTTNQEIQAIASDVPQSQGAIQQQAIDDWVDHVHASVYQDAAHSMAAVGMLAPLIESVFYQAMTQLGELYHDKQLPLPTHQRFHDPDHGWNCHYAWIGGKLRKDLVRGIREMSDALGIGKHLPPSLSMRLEALFAYRNKIFHLGFEWPMKERRAFEKRTKAEWPIEWFVWSRTGDDPWIAYLSAQFIDETLEAVSDVLTGLGRFVGDLLKRDYAPPQRGTTSPASLL